MSSMLNNLPPPPIPPAPNRANKGRGGHALYVAQIIGEAQAQLRLLSTLEGLSEAQAQQAMGMADRLEQAQYHLSAISP